MSKLLPHYQRITLGEPYADVWLDVRANPPMRVYDEFMSKDFARITAAVATLVQASNVEDEDGPVDLATVAGWGQVPKDFLELALAGLMEAISGPKATPETTSSGPTSATAETPPVTTPS